MSEQISEKLCDKIVHVIQESFPPKNFFVKISLAKNGNVYLFVRKKRGWFVGEGKEEFQKICMILFVLYLISIVKRTKIYPIIIF